MKRAIIIGATSGIGKEVAKGLLLQGWKIGVAGRRKTALDAFRTIAPDNIEVETPDVTQRMLRKDYTASSRNWVEWICFS